MIYIGIDPGLTGVVAWFDDEDEKPIPKWFQIPVKDKPGIKRNKTDGKYAAGQAYIKRQIDCFAFAEQMAIEGGYFGGKEYLTAILNDLLYTQMNPKPIDHEQDPVNYRIKQLENRIDVLKSLLFESVRESVALEDQCFAWNTRFDEQGNEDDIPF